MTRSAAPHPRHPSLPPSKIRKASDNWRYAWCVQFLLIAGLFSVVGAGYKLAGVGILILAASSWISFGQEQSIRAQQGNPYDLKYVKKIFRCSVGAAVIALAFMLTIP